MQEALRQARKALAKEEVPVGAVMVYKGKVIARAYNQVELLRDATAHAEMLVITQAEEALGDWRLNECTLYVTKEPCPMCAGAMINSRVGRVVFGAKDNKMGAAGSWMNLLEVPVFNHRCDVTPGILQKECTDLLVHFFQQRRQENNGNQ